MKCSIIGCTSSSRLFKPTSFHRLHRAGKVDEEWVKNIYELNGQFIDIETVSKAFYVCSSHFEDKYLIKLGSKTNLVQNAIPTIFPKMLEENVVVSEPVKEYEDSVASSENVYEQPPSCSGIGVNLNRQRSDLSESINVGISTPSLPKGSQLNLKRKRKFDLEQASPTTLKKKFNIYKELNKKKDNILKNIKRRLVRKEKKIESLNALIKDLEKRNMVSENGSQILQSRFQFTAVC